MVAFICVLKHWMKVTKSSCAANVQLRAEVQHFRDPVILDCQGKM